ncbi:MAG TPA: hypothetical protein VGP06_06335 [Janthinobacterium sp.]|jgi:Mn2+/Fe2+ NRAMP family transporter|nr:hypothetical protein [Janthinobacterium sp.]
MFRLPSTVPFWPAEVAGTVSVPLVRFTSRRDLMGAFVNAWWTTLLSWCLFLLISSANLWLVWRALIN